MCGTEPAYAGHGLVRRGSVLHRQNGRVPAFLSSSVVLTQRVPAYRIECSTDTGVQCAVLGVHTGMQCTLLRVYTGVQCTVLSACTRAHRCADHATFQDVKRADEETCMVCNSILASKSKPQPAFSVQIVPGMRFFALNFAVSRACPVVGCRMLLCAICLRRPTQPYSTPLRHLRYHSTASHYALPATALQYGATPSFCTDQWRICVLYCWDTQAAVACNPGVDVCEPTCASECVDACGNPLKVRVHSPLRVCAYAYVPMRRNLYVCPCTYAYVPMRIPLCGGVRRRLREPPHGACV
eukprot:1404245-Rhodomonas_salina.2